MPLVRADQLRPGDLVDLEKDPYADRDRERAYKFEYAEVIGTELEYETCLRVDLEGYGAFACPPGHQVPLEMVTEYVEGAAPLSHEPIAHVNYPHEPGRLYDCPACEARCWCDSDPGTTECIYSGEHAWTERKTGS